MNAHNLVIFFLIVVALMLVVLAHTIYNAQFKADEYFSLSNRISV